ncbi:MAG TPA: alpha/beta hydrolase [Candidatus Rubrimentiphilum sp.]|nr:alpha/beta hydrolase [Candidatus Rubrimentiphilum sp.]
MRRLLLALTLAVFASTAAARAAIPPPLPAPLKSFDSGSLHVDVYGTPGRRALVFIPGLTCGPWEWAGEIAQFSPSYTIYALTLPGFDGHPAIKPPLFQTVSADFWTLLQTESIVRPVVIGHSLGGTLAIMLAEQHSDKLGGVISVDGLPTFPGMDRMTADQRAQAAAQMTAAMAQASTPAQFAAMEKTYVLPTLMISPDDIAVVAPLAARSDIAATAAWTTEDIGLDLRAELTKVATPLLVVAPFDAALEGKVLPDADAKRGYYEALLANDPAANVQMIEPSRHFVMYDQPKKLHDAIAAFVRQHPPG